MEQGAKVWRAAVTGVRIALLTITDAILNFGILTVSYPIWREFAYQRYSETY